MIETKSTQVGAISVEYSQAIDEILQAVVHGFQRFARGGIEVGGVLYGSYDGTTAHIQAVREIACEHSDGPSFILSEGDRDALAKQLAPAAGDPGLEGLEVLGWYLSHTRSAAVLLPQDREIFHTFFPQPWQFTMVLQPTRTGTVRVGFFPQDNDGGVKTEETYLDFDVPASLGGDPGAAARRDAPGWSDTAVLPAVPRENAFPGSATGETKAPDDGAPEVPSFEAPAETKLPWQKWAMIALAVVGVANIAIIGLESMGGKPADQKITLTVFEREAQLRIEWNHAAAPILKATKGTLQIVDGKDAQIMQLGRADLARGSFTYVPNSGDVEIRFEVQDSKGTATVEETHFVNVHPRGIDADESDVAQLERDSLKDEIVRLRNVNTEQAERIAQLERTLTVLRVRLGIPASSQK